MTEAIFHDALWRIAMAAMAVAWAVALNPPGRLRDVCVALNVTIPALVWWWMWGR